MTEDMLDGLSLVMFSSVRHVPFYPDEMHVNVGFVLSVTNYDDLRVDY